MRSLLVILVLIIATPILGSAILLGAFFGVKDEPGAVYDWAPRLWCRIILAVSGVKVVIHDAHRMQTGEPRIFASNHVSWFDVFTLAGHLPHYKFVGKAELFRIPLFGPAARAAGMIPIERENRKAAFQAYEVAAQRFRNGASVVVCPEGTRGTSYRLRPFKKGPFVLAIAAAAPVVPTLVYGTIAVFPRGSWWVRSGVVHVHLLEEIPSAGLSYNQRDQLSQATWDRMSDALRTLYGVESLSAPTVPEARAPVSL